MFAELLSVVTLLGSGTTAGVFFAVALSTVPAFMAMPPDRYVYTHKMLGRNWDPTMPIIVLSTAAFDLLLAVVAPSVAAKVLAGIAAVLLLGASWVSHLRNVPINLRVKELDPERLPADWTDPRPVWRSWHLARTSLALLALAANSVAAISL